MSKKFGHICSRCGRPFLTKTAVPFSTLCGKCGKGQP